MSSSPPEKVDMWTFTATNGFVPAQERFFLIVQPGLEALAAREFVYWWPKLFSDPAPDVSLDYGGFEICCPADRALQLNYFLKIPTRILWRLAEFRCRDFPTLYNKIQKLPWRDFVENGNINWECSSKESRLAISRRIAETCASAYESYHQGHEPKSSGSHHNITAFVRLHADQCVVSIDTAGEALYRRGYRSFVTDAPLRENIAAALLWQLNGGLSPEELHSKTLIDPMTGSGTFLLEAHHLFHPNRHRPYAFESFPCFKKLAAPEKPASFESFKALIGMDQDAKAIEAATQNLAQAKASAKLEIADIFDSSAGPQGAWIIANPPYGQRLPIEENPRDYIEKLARKIEEKFRPERVGLLIPRARQRPSFPWRVQSVLEFTNGGIPVTFLAFHRDLSTKI